MIHRVPFDQSMLGGPIQPEQLPESVTDSWMQMLGLLPLNEPSADYVAEQARFLDTANKNRLRSHAGNLRGVSS